ncbi:MAG: hypothetical protein WDW36_001313 [Sanguina aurantia]
MGKVKKAAKKFLANGGKAAVLNRKKPGPFKNKAAKAAKAAAKGENEDHEADRNAKSVKAAAMEIDEFLDGGFANEDEGSEDDDSGSLEGSDGDELGGSEADSEAADFEDEDEEGEEGEEDDDELDTGDDGDDEELGGADDPVVQDNKRLRGEVSKHKAQLEALKAKDPEFYAYLQQTDEKLLGFGAGEDDSEDDDGEGDEGEMDGEEEEEDGKTAAKVGGPEGRGARRPGSQKAGEPEGGWARRPGSQKAGGPEGGGARRRGSQKAGEPEGGGARRRGSQKAGEPEGGGARRRGSQKAGEPEGGGARRRGSQKAGGCASKKSSKAKQAVEDGDGDAEEGNEINVAARLSVTSALVARWSAAAKASASLGAVRNLIKAYRLACHYGDADEESDSGMKISSSSVYNQLMLFMLKEADGVFRRMLGIERKGPAATVADVTKSNRWRKVGPLVKSYWGNSLHLLAAMTDAPLITFTLRRLRASVLLLAPFKRQGDKFLKASLGLFGSSADPGPRVQAFLSIRQMALSMPAPMMDHCLRGVYRTFIANSKFVSAASAPHIAFMITCAVELWGLELQASYQHAFSAIRQLALALRNALSMKTADSFKEVYSWQVVNCLELWGRVLGGHADKPELRPLVYPLAQLLLGAAKLVPTPRYFPLRLRLVRATNRLAASTGFFIPSAPLLLDMLQWSELRKAPTGGKAGTVPDMSLQLRVGKTVLRNAAFQEEVVQQALELLSEHLTQWSCSISFPELSHMTLLHLRRFARASPVERFRKLAKALVEAIDRNVKWVGTARDGVDYSPKDVAKVAEFLREESAAGQAPLQQFNRQLMAKAAARQALRATSEVSNRPSGKRGRGEDESDEEDDDGDGSEGGEGESGDGEGGESDEEGGDPEDDDFEGNLLPKKGSTKGPEPKATKASKAAATKATAHAEKKAKTSSPVQKRR